ncbi:MAG: sensor histidine kinase [Candidatus Nanopelagicaceae bacterium]
MPKETELTERLELARRLHDGPAQKMIALGYRLDALIGEPDLNNDFRRELREIRLDLIELTENLRDELFLLSNMDLQLAQSELRQLLPDFLIEFEVDSSVDLTPMENSIAHLILEIARNTSKYSSGDQFWVRIHLDDGALLIRIGENGAGQISIRERSLGLKLINSQVQALSGSIEIHSGDLGNEYLIEIPLP